MQAEWTGENGTAYLVYDGECPFCSRYVKMVRLRDAAGKVELVDARGGHAMVAWLKSRKVDLDDGMALVRDGNVAHGDACIHQIALMTTPIGAFNRINAALFRTPAVARLLYPVLRCGLNLALRLLGRRRIGW
jgi:predicted DCC family thiol-disulfide oxidoreductase YuxK